MSAGYCFLVEEKNTNGVWHYEIAKWFSFVYCFLKKLVISLGKIHGHLLEKIILIIKDSGETKINNIQAEQDNLGSFIHGQIEAKTAISCLLIFVSVFFFMMGGTEIYPLPKYFMAAILILVSIFLFPIRYSTVQYPIIMYLFFLVISTVFSKYPYMAFLGQYNNYASGLLPILLTIFAFCLAHETNKSLILTCFEWSGVLSAIICLGQQIDCLRPFELLRGRSYGNLGSPVYMAGFLSTTAILALSRGHWKRTAIILLGILSTKSRCGFVAFGMGALCYAFLAQKKRYITYFLLFITLIGFSAIQLSWNHDKSDMMRKVMAKTAINAFKSSPLIGIGPEHFMTYLETHRNAEIDSVFNKNTNAHCHNSILESLSATGIVGTIFLFLVFTFIFIELVDNKHFGILAVLIGAITYAMLQPLILSIKIPVAILVGSHIKSIAKFNKTFNFVAFVVMFISTILIGISFTSTRMLFNAVTVGKKSEIGRAYKIYPPFYERYKFFEDMKGK